MIASNALPVADDVQEQADPLQVWIRPDEGGPYEVDLTSFRDGGRRQDLPTRHRFAWRGDFTGRPALARELMDYLLASRPTRERIGDLLHVCRVLFRFLDDIGLPETATSASLTDDHGLLFKRWVAENAFSGSAYNRAKSVVDSLRAARRLRFLLWPPRDNIALSPVEDIDYLVL